MTQIWNRRSIGSLYLYRQFGTATFQLLFCAILHIMNTDSDYTRILASVIRVSKFFIIYSSIFTIVKYYMTLRGKTVMNRILKVIIKYQYFSFQRSHIWIWWSSTKLNELKTCNFSLPKSIKNCCRVHCLLPKLS